MQLTLGGRCECAKDKFEWAISALTQTVTVMVSCNRLIIKIGGNAVLSEFYDLTGD